MDDKLSKIVNNLQKEGVDDSAINDVVQKVKEYWSYIGNIDWNTIDYCNTLKVINCAKFLKAKFNDETKFAIMNKTLVFRDEEICIFKPTNFNESRIIGEPICCFAYSQERWNEHYEFDQEAIYYVYDVMRYGTDEDFVAITVRPNGSALVLDKKHNWWSRHDSTRFIQGLGGGAAVITTKEGKAIKSENKEYNIYKHMNKKQVIRLTESDLHRIIKESVKQILSEDIHPDDKEKENFFSWRNKEEADKRDRRDTNAYQNLSKEDRNGYFDDLKDLAAKKRNTDAKRHWDFGYRRAAGDMESDFADKAWNLDFMNNDRHEGARNYVKGGRMERWPIVSNESINKAIKESVKQFIG